jgi:hypothetical protein
MKAFSVQSLELRFNDLKKKPGFSRAYKWFKILVISAIIACLLFYGALLLLYTIATTITGYLLIFLTGVFLWYTGKKLVKWFKIPPPHPRRLRKALIIILVTWFCIESLLRIFGVHKSYNEKIGFYYSSGFVEDAEMNKRHKHLYIHPPYYSYHDNRKEFNYEIKCNADGLRDIDHPLAKSKSEYRIICVGNSFTEGIGAPQDSTWPKLLEDNLNHKSNRRISVFNAGISGTDPFFEYILLKEKMLVYHPDLVLLGLGSTDLAQYGIRGGFERFTPDGIRYRKAPKWEKLYAASYIARVLVKEALNLGKNFMTPAEFKADSIKAITETEKCIRKFEILATNEHFNLAYIFIDEGPTAYAPLIKKMKQEKETRVIDLSDYSRNVEKIDETKRKAYFWPVDGHCNSRGYAMFARGVEWNLRKMGVIDSLMKE